MSDIRTKAIGIKRFLVDMIQDARNECREFTEEEQKLFDEQKNELLALSEQIKATDDKLEEIENELPDIEEKAEDKPDEKPEAPAEDAPAEDAPAPEEAPANEPPAEEEKPAEEPSEEQTDPEEDPEKKSDSEDEKQEDTPEINNDDEKPEEEPKPEEEEPSDDDKKEKEKKSANISMTNNFSLLKAVRAAAFGEEQDALTSAVLEEGIKDFRSAGIKVGKGAITLPNETRTVTITNEHDEVVKETWEPLLLPLFKNKVLGKCHKLSGLSGDVRIPSISALDCAWEGEIDKNKETTTSFDHDTMSPHRISATIYLSKQFLMQDSLNSEQTIRNLLIEALEQKLEATYLSKNAAAGKVPGGIFNGKTAKKVTNFAQLCEFEAEAVENCYNLDKMEYVMDPKSWAQVRGTFVYGGKNSRMVMEGSEIDGRPYSITQNMGPKEFALINFDDLYFGQWGGTEITVDGTSVEMARTAQVAITLNAWFDLLVVRDEAVQLATVDASAQTIDSSTGQS